MQRFWDKVNKTETCWNWKAGSRGNGYGCIKYKGKVIDAHRFSWFLATGQMPTLWVLHACDNRKCVNPAHLREGTPLENYLDMATRGTPGILIGQQAMREKDECPYGHSYTSDNTYWKIDNRKRRAHRECRTCRMRRQRIRAARYRQEKNAGMVKQQTRMA